MTISAPLAYAAIYFATMIEGEVVFVTASIMVSAGTLKPLPVILAGALGAATGDQFYFYALRGRVHRWLGRLRAIARRQEAIVARVRRHELAMILALRFAPGLRIAIAAACAYAGVAPLRFSVWNLLTAFVWATGLMTVVAWGGPNVLAPLGLSPVTGAMVAGLCVVTFGWWLGRDVRKPT